MILNNGLQFLDFSHAFEVAPRKNKLITDLGLFEKKFGRSTIAEVIKVSTLDGDITGSRRGGDRNFQGSEDAVVKHFRIPFYTLDRPVDAADVQDFVKYMEPDSPKTSEDVVRRNVTAMMSKWQNRWEKLQVQAIMGTGGDASVETYNYYTVWGQTQTSFAVDFASATVDPMTDIEIKGRQKIIELIGDQSDDIGITVLASTSWFQKLIDNPFVTDAYKFYSSTQEPLRQRLSGDRIYREFFHGTVRFIEVISGYIPAGEAYMIPNGVEGMFTMHFAPSDTVAGANEVAKDSYLFIEQTLRKISVESESSVLCVNSRPELVIKMTVA